MPSFPRKIPRLRVNVDRAGQLTPFHPGKDTDPDWWGAVLSDPRVRTCGGDKWQDMLGRHHGEELILSCSKCHRRSEHSVDDLIVRYGATCPCQAAAARIVDDGQGCQRGQDCTLTYDTTKSYRPPER